MLRRGRGVAKDFDKAIELFEKVNRLGGDAYKALANVKNLKKLKAFDDGGNYFMSKQFSKALPLFLIAEDLGHKDASFSLGCIYLIGKDGVAHDLKKGVEYLVKNMGERDAYDFVGGMYLSGDEVDVNLKIAVEYLQKACDLGKKESKKPLKAAKKLLKKEKKGGK